MPPCFTASLTKTALPTLLSVNGHANKLQRKKTNMYSPPVQHLILDLRELLISKRILLVRTRLDVFLFLCHLMALEGGLDGAMLRLDFCCHDRQIAFFFLLLSEISAAGSIESSFDSPVTTDDCYHCIDTNQQDYCQQCQQRQRTRTIMPPSMNESEVEHS